jgi:hypothetical protein
MDLKEKLNIIKKQLHDINLNRPLNIFDISLIATREVSHSAFLAWLLNPKENHKLGDLFLKELFMLLKINQKYKSNDIEVDTEISEKYRRIDIIIEFDNQKVCIENKIEDYPTIEQITDEIELFKPTIMILLAPSVTLKNFKEELKKLPEVKTISYEQIHNILNKIIEDSNSDVKYVLQQYINNLEVNIMANKLNNFNEKSLLYVKHSDEIDEIIEEFEEERKEIWKIFLKRLKKKFPDFNYKHFDNWEYIILQKEKWLKKKEYDIYIAIDLMAEDVKKNETVFYICFTKKSYPKINQIRKNIKKRMNNSLKKIGYSFADETYCLYKKTIKIENNYVDTFYNEFNKLIEIDIIEAIEESIKES